MKELPIGKIVSKAVEQYSEIDEESVPGIALLAHGMTQTAVAKVLGVSKYSVGKWMDSPGYLSAIAIVKDNIDAWHKAQFSVVAALAWKKIIDLLSEDIKIGDPGYKEQIRVAEAMILKVVSRNEGFDQEVADEGTTTLQVHPSSVDIIARRITELQGGNGAATHERNTRKIDLENMPPVIACHPDTNYGSMSRGSNGSYLCHVCGKEPNNFFDHIESAHGIGAMAYAKTYGIDSVTFAAEYSR